MLQESHLNTSSPLSNSGQRQILWNVVQPGDPYDIKKSVIVKIPGDKKLFMGNQLELVCLLQAAEIQRLSQYLQDHKIKFRETERSILDRHSYEVQIKELTQEVYQYQTETGKLREFIKMQEAQIQHLLKNNTTNIDQNFQQIYEENTQKIKKLTSQNTILIELNQQYRLHQENFIAKLKAFQTAKLRQIQELKLNYVQQSQQNYQTTLNVHKFQSQGQIRRLQFELKKIKESCDQKNHEIANLIKSNSAYVKQLSVYKDMQETMKALQQKIYEFENKIIFAASQIDRKAIVLTQISNKYQQSQKKTKDLEQQIRILKISIEQYEQRIKTSTIQIFKLKQMVKTLEGPKSLPNNQNAYLLYQTKTKQLTQNNQMLNFKILQQVKRSQGYRQQLQKLTFENSKYKLLQRQNIQMKQNLLEKDFLKRKTIDLQNNLNIINQQIQMIFKDSQAKDKELQKYRIMAYEHQQLQIRIKEVQVGITNKYQAQLTRTKIEYQNKIEYLTRTKGNQFLSKAQIYQKQSERLKQILKNKLEEFQRQRARIYELQNYLKKTQLQASTKVRNIQNNFVSIKKQNNQLYIKTRRLEQTQRQLHNKSLEIQNENTRLTFLITAHQKELSSIKNKLFENEAFIKKSQLDFNLKMSDYENNIGMVRLQNEELRKKINQFKNHSNNKINQSNRQINTLNINVRNANDEKNQLDLKYRQITQQFQKNKQNLLIVSHQNQDLRKRLQQAQIKNINLFNQTAFNHKIFIQQNQNLKKQLNECKIVINRYQLQSSTKIANNQQRLVLFSKQNQVLKRKNNEYELQLNNMILQLNNINSINKNLTIQYQKLRKYHQQHQISVQNRFKGQIHKSTTYEQNIFALNNQLETYKKKKYDLQSTIFQQNQELQKIDTALKNSLSQQQNLKKQLISKDSYLSNFQISHKNRIITYQQSLKNLKEAHEVLKATYNNNIISLNKKAEEYQQLNQKNHLLSVQHQALLKKHNTLQNQFKNKIEGQVVKRYNNYEQMIKKIQQEKNAISKQLQGLNKQHQKLLVNLNQKLSQNQSLTKNIQNYQTSIAAYQIQVNKRLAIYEQNIFQLTKQRQKLIQILQNEKSQKTLKFIEYQQKITNLAQQSEKISLDFKQLVQRHNEDFLKNIPQLNNNQGKVGELYNRYIMASEQVQRLTAQLKIKQLQISKIQRRNVNQSNQIQTLKKKYNQVQFNFKQNYQSQIVAYQQRMAELTKKINQNDNKNIELQQQNQRLNTLLKSKIQEQSQFAVNLNTLNQLDQLKKIGKQNQNSLIENINILQEQNEYLKKEKKGFQSDYIQEYNKRLQIAYQEIEELQQNILLKDNQLQSFINQLKNCQKSYQFLNLQKQTYSANIQTLQHKVNSLSQQNDIYRRKLAQLSEGSDQDKLSMLSQGNERFKNILQSKLQEIQRLQAVNLNLLGEIDQLKRTNPELKQLKRQITEYQQKIKTTIEQNQQLQSSLKYKTDSLANIQLNLNQSIKLNNQLKQKIAENELNWKTKIGIDLQKNSNFMPKEYQSKIEILEQEIKRINKGYKQKNYQLQRRILQLQNLKQFSQKKIQFSQNQISNWQSNYKFISEQYEKSNKHLQEYQQNLKKLYGQFERLQNIINDLRRQRQKLIDKNYALGQEINYLQEKNKDLEIQAKDIRLYLSDENFYEKGQKEKNGLQNENAMIEQSKKGEEEKNEEQNEKYMNQGTI